MVRKEDYPWASSIEKPIKLAPTFRLIATMNSYDRAVLFSLGYAFRRRFAFVEIPSPYLSPIDAEYDIETAEERWRDKAEQRSRAYESVSDEISRWLTEDVDSRKIHPPKLLDMGVEEALQEVWSKIRDETVWSPSAVLDSLAKWMTDNKMVEMGYAQTVDSIKFTLVYLAYEGLTPENAMKAVDKAFLAYIMPQLEYFLPKVRREKIMSRTEEGEGRKKLDALLGILESLGLIESHAKYVHWK